MVFLDFGFMQIVSEKPGEKTMTSFLGTLRYCSPEMRKLYFLSTTALVDLYDNDCFGLNMIFEEFEKKLHEFDSFHLIINDDKE